MGIICTTLIADLILFCYERNFILSLSDYNPADIFGAFKSTDDLLDDISYPYFEHKVYPTEHLLDKANSFDTEAPFLDLYVSNK